MSYYNSGRRDDNDDYEERTTETYSRTDDDRGYGRRDDDRFTETTTTTTSYDGGPPPPPQVSYPWRAQWDDRERRYLYIHQDTGERSWELPNRGYGEQTYEQQSTTYVEEDRGERRGGGGHGLAYGALGAGAGLAGGAYLMHESGEARQDWEQDKYRMEENVENFPDDAARWTGRKVGEVEDIPQDVEQGFDRFGERVEQRWDNAVDDVEYAPENAARWAGEKVGNVERFGDNVDNAYDEGKYEGRNDGDRW